MYSSCLFCSAPFGRNREIEHLPIGRRIAYDEHQGRLWIVCRQCDRWNLTPFDERWEAIEQCERRFRDTQVRISSDNIGLARLDEGLELVRIGQPLRPEFAAWRYGGRFLARRYRRVLHAVRNGGLLALPVLSLAISPLAPLGCSAVAALAAYRLWRRPSLRIGFEGDEELGLNLQQIQRSVLIQDPGAPDGWGIMVERLPEPPSARWARIRRKFQDREVVLTGADARLVAAMVLPRLNVLGGDADTVTEATRWLTAAGGPAHAFRTFARSHHVRPALDAHRGMLATMHPGVRLALEMALHEDEEHKALAGELSVLAWAWRREERLAAIADGLGIPESVERQLAELRRGYL